MSDGELPGKGVIVVIGAGSIGQSIARLVSAGKHVLLADLRQENAAAAADVLSNAGFEANTKTVDVSSRDSIHKLVGAATRIVALLRCNTEDAIFQFVNPIMAEAKARWKETVVRANQIGVANSRYLELTQKKLESSLIGDAG
jgi:NADP-dependent 3-hydroxy acid dehydrogenase YdfG